MKYQDGTHSTTNGAKAVSPEDAAWCARPLTALTFVPAPIAVTRADNSSHQHRLDGHSGAHCCRHHGRRSERVLTGRAEVAATIYATRLGCDGSPLVRRRFREAMAAHMQDHTERMRAIKSRLEGGSDSGREGGDATASVAEKEELLDELVEIVENIDYARCTVLPYWSLSGLAGGIYPHMPDSAQRSYMLA